MMTKAELHDMIDMLIPPTTKGKSATRVIVHAMIDLELITSMKCSYEHCVFETREFEKLNGNQRIRGGVMLDHVIDIADGGTDRPENMRMIHFACNSAKGTRSMLARPGNMQRLSEGLKKRWEDPEYRANIISKTTAGHRRPEVQASKSTKMATNWADPEVRARRTEATRRAWAPGGARRIKHEERLKGNS